jgi:hypothetical protein
MLTKQKLRRSRFKLLRRSVTLLKEVFRGWAGISEYSSISLQDQGFNS